MGFFKNRREKKSRLIEWQHTLMPDSPNRLVTTEAELKRATNERIRGCLKITTDSADILTTTVNPDVFFSRYDLMLDRFNEVVTLSAFVLVTFSGKTAADMYNKLAAGYHAETQKFIHRFISDRVDKARVLKTERGRVGRYQKAYDELRAYYPRMSPENIELAEKAFPGVTKGGDIQ